MLLLAGAVAVLHGAVVLFMLTGSLLALRQPGLVRVHAPVALVVLGINLAGAPCPLTTVELALRERAGAAPYDGGFLGHFVFGPLGLDVRSAAVQAGMYTVALGLNAVGYGLLLAHTRRSRLQPAGLQRDDHHDHHGDQDGRRRQRALQSHRRPPLVAHEGEQHRLGAVQRAVPGREDRTGHLRGRDHAVPRRR